MAQPTDTEIENSPTLTWLKENGLPLDRKHYISVATFGMENYDWTAEDEAGMPASLRDPDALEQERSER
jgi:hypothetical protein